jgi:dihydropteroate synthase
LEHLLPPANCGHRIFKWGERTFVMGIINLSPDSFSGDGLASPEAALVQASRMIAEGADIIDVGGESTRPDSQPISTEEEIQRVIPTIARLSREINAPISVDTYKYEVAYAAVAAGADILNDIWALRHEPRLAGLAATHHLSIILMSNQRGNAVIGDIMAEITADLKRAIGMCLNAGVVRESIIVDPGIGFGKTPDQNLEILRRLQELKSLGLPVLLGTSRKSFIGAVLDVPVTERLSGTLATEAIGIAHGADIVRVHDVAASVQAARMCDAIIRRRKHE